MILHLAACPISGGHFNDIDLDTGPHFKKFFRHYQECSQTEVKSFLALIKEYDFILYQSVSDETQYRGKAGDLYFPSEHLQWWFQPKPETKFICFDEYLQLVGEDEEEELINFFTELGVKDVPRIFFRKLSWQEAHEIQSNWPRSTKGQSWMEKYIHGCKELLETIVDEQNSELSRLVWSQLLKFVKDGYLKDDNYGSRNSVLCVVRGKFWNTQ